MANYNEQLILAWEEWVKSTDDNANDPNEFIDWAIKNSKIAPKPEDIRKIFRRQVSTALRQVMRTDKEGVTYRAKQCVKINEGGEQRTFWFDIDDQGTPQLRRKAAKQKRDSIACKVYRAKSDIEHMNNVYGEKDGQIEFVLDFTDDYEERKALEELEHLQNKKKKA